MKAVQPHSDDSRVSPASAFYRYGGRPIAVHPPRRALILVGADERRRAAASIARSVDRNRDGARPGAGVPPPAPAFGRGRDYRRNRAGSFAARLGGAPGAFTYLFPPAVISFLSAISRLGVILYMFLVGLEIDPSLFRGQSRGTVTIAQSGIIAPFVLGVLIAIPLYPHLSVPDGHSAAFLHLPGDRDGGHRVSGAGPNPHRSSHP